MSSDLKRQIINMGRFWQLLSLLALIISCNGQKKIAENTDASSEQMTLVDQNNYSGVDSTETMVIKSSKALKAFYSRINRTRKPGLPVPEIDFSKNIVVVLCSSNENYEGSEQLAVLEETDVEMVLGMQKVVKNQKDTSTLNLNAQVSPFFVYKMPLTEKKVSFKMMK